MTDGRKPVLMGVIGAAQGLKGEVRVKSFSADPGALGAYGPLEAKDGRRLSVESIRPLGKDMVAVRFKGVSDRTAAEGLNGTELFVPRENLPEAGEEEFYHADLVGLAVRDADGNAFGRVRAVHDFGGGDVLELEGGRGAMIPFTQAAVPAVDVKGGFVIVDPRAAGMIEDEGDEEEEAP